MGRLTFRQGNDAEPPERRTSARRPPRFANWLLNRFSPPGFEDELQGDLLEMYAYWVKTVGLPAARGRYIVAVLRLIQPFARSNPKPSANYFPQSNPTHPTMVRNALKTAWRHWRKQPGFTLINGFGLAAGLTCFTFIALWLQDELGYDRCFPHYDRLFRVTQSQQTETGLAESARTGAAVAPALSDHYPQTEKTVRLRKHSEIIVHQNQQTLQPNILLTESSFFDLFGYRLTRGNVATALQAPYSVVLTESTAKKYFGQADPMGQLLTIYMYDSTGRGANYKVTGIAPDPSPKAHFTFTMLASFKTVEVARPELIRAEGWTDNRFYTYVRLQKGVDQQSFSTKVAPLYTNYGGGQSNTEHTALQFRLQPVADIHLQSHLDHELAPNGSVTQVYIFATIGLFILLLAGINYTNLATARSVNRAKEVSVKKVMGAIKAELVMHYLIESIGMTLLALGLSVLLVLLIQPFLEGLTGKSLSLLASPGLLLFLTGVSILLGTLSGLYPAFVLSSFKPAVVLKGSFKTGTKGIFLRRSLVVAQFVITLLLLISVVIVYSQMNFIRHKDLGYNKSALLFLKVNGNANVVSGYPSFKQDLLANSLIEGVATSNSILLNGLETDHAQTTDGQGRSIPVTTAQLQVNADYLTVYGVKLLAGTNFTNRVTDRLIGQTDYAQPVILNESAVRRLGWKNPQAALGKPFTADGQPGTVVGVVGDFHFNSLQHAIEPLAISLKSDYFSQITVKIDPHQARQSVALIKTVWNTHFPGTLLEYAFLDSEVDKQYQADDRFASLVTYFSILSLLIACLGLYSLIAYATAQRRKEIGIRKALGASVGSVVVLLSSEFLHLVLLASIIAVPIAWYAMHHWLQGFAYRIAVEWWMFIGSIGLVLLVALLTVSTQTIKAALINPIKTLRTE